MKLTNSRNTLLAPLYLPSGAEVGDEGGGGGGGEDEGGGRRMVTVIKQHGTEWNEALTHLFGT